jgi:magnesium transporter
MSNFTVTKEFIAELKIAVEARQTEQVRNLLADLHPEDVAEMLYDFNTEDSKFVYCII